MIDFRWNRDGVTREVLLWRRWAIKLPSIRSWSLFLQGLLCNMTERDIWRSSGIVDSMLAPHRNDLCPVLWCLWGGWCLVMRRGQPVTPAQWSTGDGILTRLDGVISDCKLDAFCWLEDRIVCVDYGAYKWGLSDAEMLHREQFERARRAAEAMKS